MLEDRIMISTIEKVIKTNSNYLEFLRKVFLPVLILFAFVPIVVGQKVPAGELYIAKVFTPPNIFTSGIEGPAVDKNGNLYAVNFNQKGTVGMVNYKGEASLFIKLPEGSTGNGIRFNSRGNMLIADYVKHNILEVDMKSGKIRVLAHEPHMNQPNDIAIDNKNRVYASDPNWKNGSGKIWSISDKGEVTLVRDSLGTTNGIELSPDDKILYVNETVQKKIWAFDINPDGSLKNKRLFIEFSDFGMDGMRCDVKGNLYVTRYGKGSVVMLSPKGNLLKEIKLRGKNPSNIAFGGEDGCTVYVTLQDQGNIESFRVPFAGRAFRMNNMERE